MLALLTMRGIIQNGEIALWEGIALAVIPFAQAALTRTMAFCRETVDRLTGKPDHRERT